MIESKLETLVEYQTSGNPMKGAKWIRDSLRNLSQELTSRGHPISPPTVSRLLKKQGYSLKVNRKDKEDAPQHPDRNKQFEYIETQRKRCKKEGLPSISVDSKKKELIGEFKNAGKSWCVEGPRVNAHDFPSLGLGKSVPYGVYDEFRNRGYVGVGISSDTSEFAVDVIKRWWEEVGSNIYSSKTDLLILADSGGSNGYRTRLWKKLLQEELCDKFGLTVTVCHYPPGCSKWNPVEHKLFSHISLNWSGKPLRNYEVMFSYIRGTKTSTGLSVNSFLTDKIYMTGIKVSDREMKDLNIEFHKVCPQWNYTIRPRLDVGKRV